MYSSGGFKEDTCVTINWHLKSGSQKNPEKTAYKLFMGKVLFGEKNVHKGNKQKGQEANQARAVLTALKRGSPLKQAGLRS